MENESWNQTTRQRIASINTRIDKVLATLQWDRDDLKEWSTNQPQRDGHARYAEAEDKLETRKMGCFDKRRTKKILPSSARYFYTHAPWVLSFSDQQPVQGGAHVHQMIPASIPLTEYASLAKTIRAQHGLPAPRVYVDQVEEMEDSGDPSTSRPMKTQKETDAAQRDYKRRRKAYRVKVDAKHRSSVEVQRQLVEAYMQEL